MTMKEKRFASMVKLTASLALAMGLASTAHAATTFRVQGTQSYSIDLATDSVESGGVGGILTQNPSPPTFSGLWTFSFDTGALLHSFDFAPYSIELDMSATGLGVIGMTVPNRVLKMTHGMYYPGVNSFNLANVSFQETSPGILCDDGGTGLCGAALLPGPTAPSHGDFTMIFAPDMLSFTGVANVYQLIDPLSVDNTGRCLAEGGLNPCTNNVLTFSGTAVPVPAAAWLFGSGIVGMIGLKRRKAA
jgi:hypothetical protein